ncbi:MAG TPA: hypothetical protein VGH28_04315 [Polyangiaceae bacterium]|jgi:hypothetical protein
MKAAGALAMLAFVFLAPHASAQERDSHPKHTHEHVPVMRFPMSAANYRKLMDAWIAQAKKMQPRLDSAQSAAVDKFVLESRACTDAVTADGVVTSAEAGHCIAKLTTIFKP